MKILSLSCALMLSSIVASAQCTASLTAVHSPQSGDLLHCIITNTSSYGTVTGSQKITTTFNFGDGYTSTQSSTTHNYAAPGTYSLGLRINKIDTFTHSVICTDTATSIITVAYPSCGSAVTATGNFYDGTRTFTASIPAGTTGMTYNWDFGDGTTATGNPVTHTYSSTGSQYPQLITSHAASPTCSYTNNLSPLYISYLSFCDYVSSSNSFTGSLSGPTLTLTQWDYFTDLVSTRTYDYGDGSAITTSTVHTYATPGTHVVTEYLQWKDSITNNLVCLDTTIHSFSIWSSVSGNIYCDTVNFNYPHSYKVWLIQYNPTTNMLTAVDSTSSYHFASPWSDYTFTNVQPGNYLVKARDSFNNIGSAGPVPTYHDSSILWNTAQTISQPGYGTVWADIWMKSGTMTAGPGFVAGNVSLGANKGAANSVEGLSLFLINTADNSMLTAITNSSGDYSFSNFPVGNYSIYPEALNYVTIPAAINLTVGNTNLTGINFHQDDAKMSIMPYGLSTMPLTVKSTKVALAPNPARHSVSISWHNCNPSGASVLISDVTGRLVLQTEIRANANNGSQKADISMLQPGIYCVRCTGCLADVPMKLVVE